MGSFDEPTRVGIPRVREGILHLMRNRAQGAPEPEALMRLADDYLRLNPEDEEVRRVRDRLRDGTERADDLRGCF